MVQNIGCFLPIYCSIGKHWHHCWRVITPDAQVFNISNFAVSFLSNLSKCSVMIQLSHGSEIFLRYVFSIMLSDQTIGIAWITNHQNFTGTLSIIIQSLTSSDKYLSIIFD